MTKKVAKGLLLLACAFALVEFLCPQVSESAGAGSILQVLDREKSSVEFVLLSDVTSLFGSFGDFSGRLNLKANELTSSSVRVEVDLSQVEVTTASGAVLWPINMLFKSVSSPIATFESTKIIDQGKGQYMVHGIAVVQGRRREVALPVTLVRTSPRESLFTAQFSGEINNASSYVPEQIAALARRGRIKFSLLFRKA